MFSSEAIEVVGITSGDVVVNMSYKLELEDVLKPQARPRLGRNGFFPLQSQQQGQESIQGS